MELLNTIY